MRMVETLTDYKQAEGSPVTLPRRTPSCSSLRIGTLSWEWEEPGKQLPDELMASLGATSDTWKDLDLIVAAGLSVSKAPTAEDILKASRGTPVLFEAKTSWLLVHQRDEGPTQTLLREGQLLSRSNQMAEKTLLASVIASRAGVIAFEGMDLCLVLFICGENNLLQPNAGRSVLRADPDDLKDGQLRTVIGRTWAVLNPAHRPYLRQDIRTSGFGKIGKGKNKGGTFGPTLKRLVESRRQYQDGTTAPVAVIHVNNFSRGRQNTLTYSSVTFGDTVGRVKRVSSTATGEVCRDEPGRTRQWRADVYDIRGERDLS